MYYNCSKTGGGNARNAQRSMALMEQPMPFILLGEPDLLNVGFDVTRHLGAVKERYHESGFSTANKFLSEATVSAVTGTPVIVSLTASLCLMNHNLIDNYDEMPELWESDDESCTDYDDMPELEDLYELGGLNVDTERFSFNLAALNAERQQRYLVYGDIPDDDPHTDYHYIEVGKDDPEALHQAVEDMLSNAINNGILSEAGNVILKKLVYKHRDIWALKMGAGEHANVPPCRSSSSQERNQ
jgi:hypothetical protein